MQNSNCHCRIFRVEGEMRRKYAQKALQDATLLINKSEQFMVFGKVEDQSQLVCLMHGTGVDTATTLCTIVKELMVVLNQTQEPIRSLALLRMTEIFRETLNEGPKP